MRFKRALQRYGRTPEPETPYQRAGQVWDERIGSARAQARNWRLMAFGGLGLTIGLSSALVWQSMQSRVLPYVVEVDRLGEPRAVAPADADYRPTDPQIAWHLAHFISNIRSKSLDPVLMRENWLAAYDFVTDRGKLFLDEYARAANPFAEIGERTVSVQVTSVVRASDTSFQVKWSESLFERGSLAGTSRWTAILTIRQRPPRSAETLRKNPLGIYVDAIDWSRELETAAPPGPPGVAAPAATAAPREAPAFAPSSSAIPQGSPLDPASGPGAAGQAPSIERNAQ
jgi:type IV secretion system protein VirB5